MENELLQGVLSNREWLQLLFLGFFLLAVPTAVRLRLAKKNKQTSQSSQAPTRPPGLALHFAEVKQSNRVD